MGPNDLARLPLFASVHEEILEILAADAVERDIAPDEVFLDQDAPAAGIGLVTEGRLDSTLRDARDGLEYEGPRYGPGEVVGLVEVMMNTPCAMVVRASEPTRAVVLGKTAILAACDEFPILAATLLRTVAERVGAGAGGAPARGGVDLARLRVDESLWTLVPQAHLVRYKVLPLARNGRILIVGFADPNDLNVVDDVSRLVPGFKVRPVAVDPAELQRFMRNRVLPALDRAVPEQSDRDRWFHSIKQKASEVRLVDTAPSAAPDERARQVSGEMVVALVNRLIGEALELAASDIHIEPSEHELTVRYRMDGRLKRRPEPLDIRFHSPLVSRLKALGRMDIAERRKAQDGRLTVEHGKRQIDFRLSTVPTRFGEKIVLRILDPSTILIDLERLVLHEPSYRAARWMIDQPQGMVIVAGPTGSGKTTTIYSALMRLRESEINILTIEDPIEYTIEGVSQVQVNDAAGVSFANTIRHFLRQDPDVIVVGETRDPQTASTTVEAALTGHLVFTSLHANDALGTLARLREMGVESFLLAHTVIGVISQRLLRRVCPHCRQPATYHRDMVRPLGLFREDEIQGSYTFLRGTGCMNCNYQGYKGRVGAFEVLRVDERLRPVIAVGEPLDVVERVARETGLLQPLRENCRHLLVNGITTPEEIARVLFVN